MAWHDKFQVWLSESQSLENAQNIANYYYKDGSDWTKESIAAMIGNMRHESSVNPNMYEYGYDWSADRGYGLVQWTPRSKYWDWAVSKGLDPEKAESQLARIDFEVDNNIQWIPKATVFNGLTFKEFRTNSKKLSVDQLTEAFTWGYERPRQDAGEQSMPARKAFARRALNELKWSGGGGGGGGGGGDPTPKPPVVDTGKINDILEQGKVDLLNSIEVDYQKAIDHIMKEFEKLFSTPLFNISKDYEINGYFKILHTFKNQLKINPRPKLLKDMLKIVMDAMKMIKVNVDVDGVFNNMWKGILDVIPDPAPEPKPDPDPPKGEKFFPVDYKANGINFWYPPYSDNTTRNMDFGTRTTGDFHAGYDIGGGGINHNIYAVSGGEVIDARQAGGWGQIVVIDHADDKYYSLYAHLVVGSNTVKIGDKVKAGQLIGKMGNSGGNYAIHLHYELSTSTKFDDNGDVLDPKPYLGVTGNNKTSLKNPIG